MFKKRTVNKSGQNKDEGKSQGIFTKRLNVGGIDLRRDIEQLQTNIKQNKTTNESQKQINTQQKEQQQRGYGSHQSYQLPKTKKINKFTSHIINKLPTININSNLKNTLQKPFKQLNKHFQSDQGKIQQTDSNNLNFTNNTNVGLVKPVLANYGLLDKSHFKQSQTKIQIIQQNKTHQQTLMDYYIKKKMQQLTKTTTNTSQSNLPSQTNKSNTYTLRQRPTQTWQEVLHLQNQYLTQQEKIKSYSIQQIEKKLQKQAHQIIKSEIEKRNSYLKDLLENQYERMEYASKKQLKIIKQEKQRVQKQLNSKYKDTGRRHFIDSIKNSVL